MKFEIRKSKNDQVYFNVVAANGEPVATSETYKSYDSCLHAVRLIIADASKAEIKDLRYVSHFS
ncbi:DUF1508 domain-containing protein [Exiguobacterium sp. LL15]|uniref:YegP family protein n=1 Tax=Exiguobacterium sp. LL15 TaxID=2950547 RepID=UPI00210C4DB7|nr:DUF1508 domain-containing protein [Exiguobacterium sp. LL15]MCQ4089450.1 DUF1508 domain-containing protein [Exiguobacterium sp. LL15]